MNKFCQLFVIIGFLCVSACGGSGGGTTTETPMVTPPVTPPVSGIARTGVAGGPISTFGSMFVNGVKYQTDNASFDINGVTGTQSDLRVGQYVVVKGEINQDLISGQAIEVIFDDNVKGPVQSINPGAGQMVVLGQTVLITSTTSFDNGISPGSLAGLAVGDIVEVSGLVDANGAIVATRIDPQPGVSLFEVTGQVSAADNANTAFSVNGLRVDYSNAALDDFDGNDITDGDLVEVKGSSFDPNNNFIATRVEKKNQQLQGDDGDQIEVEGFITRFASPEDFDISGISVIGNANTEYEGGVAADLGLNVKVEVEGQFDVSGNIIASKIDIRRAKAVRISAAIDALDTANNSLVILNIPVNVDTLTRLEDKTDAEIEPLTINDLSVGDYLEVRGSEVTSGGGTVLATILEREDADSESELQGFVTAIAEPTLTILGVMIETTNSTRFEDGAGNTLSRTEFFAQLAVNSLVKASGVQTSTGVITADEVEFEFEN